MAAQIKNFKTDFTRFLGGNIRHTVQIVTKEETLECSGALLSQHSEVMRQMVDKEEEIFLTCYDFVKDCLVILHGGSVEFTEENCEEIIKFGIQFGLTDIVEQGLQYLNSNTDENNLTNSRKICTNVNRFAESCNSDANIDYFWPLEGTVKKLSPSAVEKFVADTNATAGIKAILEMIRNKSLARKLLNYFFSLMDQSNIGEILGIFSYYENCDEYAEAFSDCTKNEILSFFEGVEKLELQKKQFRTLQIMKKCFLKEWETNKLKPKHINKDCWKTWRQFSEEKIVQICKVFKTDFYLLEVVMSWVALNKPDSKIVRQLCSLMNTTELRKEYLEHVIEVFKAEGYDVSFDLDNCSQEKDFNILNDSQDMHVIISYAYENDEYKVKSKSFYVTSRDQHFNNARIVVKITEDGISWERSTTNCRKLYGRTDEGKQIAFHTDSGAAMKDMTSYDFITFRSLK